MAFMLARQAERHGGLTISTLITLVFIPVVYMFLEERAARERRREEPVSALEPASTAGD